MIPDPAAPAPPRPAARAEARAPSQPAEAPADAPGPVAPPAPNPSLRIDTALNLVVLEFRDARGEVQTIPTARELDAYRSAPPEPAPGLDVTR